MCRGKMEKKDVKRRERERETRMESAIEVAEAPLRRERDGGIEQAEERKEGVRALRGARAARAGERMRDARARTGDRGATRTAATVRHEREQGDERVSESARRRSL